MAGYCVSEADPGVCTAHAVFLICCGVRVRYPWSKSSHKKAHLHLMSRSDRFKVDLRSQGYA